MEGAYKLDKQHENTLANRRICMAKSKKARSAQSLSNQQLVSLASAVSSTAARKVKKKAKKAKKSFSEALPSFIEAVVDPWSAPGLEFAEPDENKIPTVSWTDACHQTLSTDANGEIIFQIAPLWAKIMTQCPLSSAGVVTTLGAASHTTSNSSSIATTFSKYRTVSFAWTVEYIGTRDGAKGVLGGVLGTQTLVTGDTFATYMDEPGYRELNVTDGGELAGMCRCVNPQWFLSNATTMMTDNLCMIGIVLGTGLPASEACIRVAIRMNAECVVHVDSLLSSSARLTPHYPAAVATANTVTGYNNEIETGHNAKDKLVKKRRKIAKVAAELNGIINTGRQWLPIMAELATLL